MARRPAAAARQAAPWILPLQLVPLLLLLLLLPPAARAALSDEPLARAQARLAALLPALQQQAHAAAAAAGRDPAGGRPLNGGGVDQAALVRALQAEVRLTRVCCLSS